MRLTLQWVEGHDIRTSTATRLVGHTLAVHLEALQALLETDTRLQRVRLDLAHPGEACRIGRVCDLPAPTRVPAALVCANARMQHLPWVAYVFQIHSHQRPTGTEAGMLYDDPVRRMLLTIVHPNEVLDGAVRRGFMGRNATTYGPAQRPGDDPLPARLHER